MKADESLARLEERLRQVDALQARLAAWERVCTWTPYFFGSGTPGTFTYAVQDGQYSRLGPWAIIAGRLQISAISVAPTSNMRIGGLPLAVAAPAPAGVHHGGVAFTRVGNMIFTAGALMLTGSLFANQRYIQLYEVFSNVASTAYPAANFTNAGATLFFSAWYLAA